MVGGRGCVEVQVLGHGLIESKCLIHAELLEHHDHDAVLYGYVAADKPLLLGVAEHQEPGAPHIAAVGRVAPRIEYAPDHLAGHRLRLKLAYALPAVDEALYGRGLLLGEALPGRGLQLNLLALPHSHGVLHIPCTPPDVRWVHG